MKKEKTWIYLLMGAVVLLLLSTLFLFFTSISKEETKESEVTKELKFVYSRVLGVNGEINNYAIPKESSRFEFTNGRILVFDDKGNILSNMPFQVTPPPMPNDTIQPDINDRTPVEK